MNEEEFRLLVEQDEDLEAAEENNEDEKDVDISGSECTGICVPNVSSFC